MREPQALVRVFISSSRITLPGKSLEEQSHGMGIVGELSGVGRLAQKFEFKN